MTEKPGLYSWMFDFCFQSVPGAPTPSPYWVPEGPFPRI